MHNICPPIRNGCLFSLALACAIGLSRSASAADAKPAADATKAAAEKPAEAPKIAKQLPDGRVFLTARETTVHGTKLHYEKQKATLGYWFDAADWVSWEFEITQPGKMFVDLTQSCGPDSAGSHYTVEVGDQKLKDKVQETGSFRLFRPRRLGIFEFAKPGVYTLSIHVQDKPRLAVMDLRAVTLQPPDFEKRLFGEARAKKPAAASEPNGPPAPSVIAPPKK